MSECPCGHDLEIKTVTNLSLHCEVEILTCLCGKIRKSYTEDSERASFIQFTHKLMGIEVPKSCRSNERSQNKFEALAASL